MRPTCNSCLINPCAVNYVKDGVKHYRKKCDRCSRTPGSTRKTTWQLSGYKKKPHCEKCGFKAKHESQLNVFHLDGDLRNAQWINLKTICANCQRLFGKVEKAWRTGDLIPD